VESAFLAFLGVSILVIVTPGPDTALTIRNSLLGGRAGGLGTALGVSTGQLIWALAASAGLAAILAASEPLFHAVRLAGAAYLVWLGPQSLRTALRPRPRAAAGCEWSRAGHLRPRVAFTQGVVNNLGNPKMAVIFASVLPQFAAPAQGMASTLMMLGLIFSALTFGWLSLYATAVSAIGDLMRAPAVRRAVEAVNGAILIGLGAKLALDARS
jgi:threonine/homoserine/homoserine lactone efflux protein